MTQVVVVDSGVANLASVCAAFGRLGAEVAVMREPAAVAGAQRVVLAGAGSFSAGMVALESHGLDDAVLDAVERGTSLLATGIGLQLLCQASEETPGLAGLGLIPETCRRLPAGVRVPHLGWNRVEPDRLCRLVEPGEGAFANSYCLADAPQGFAAAWTTHGVEFVAALERDSVLACQFQPELSGTWGLELLERWLSGSPLSAAPSLPPRPAGLARRLVPCLYLREGRVVKREMGELVDAGDPAEWAVEYERRGADQIVLLDIPGSPSSRARLVDTVRRVRAVLGIPLLVGGGVRSVDDARHLLAAGADEVSVNTAAVHRPELLAEMAQAFGRQCVVLAVDAWRAGPGWELLVMAGREATGADAIQWARRGVELGAGEILLTSRDSVGARAGCDLELVRAVAEAVSVPVIASSAAGSQEDVMTAIAADAEAVLAASVFGDGEHTMQELKADLAARGVPVRR